MSDKMHQAEQLFYQLLEQTPQNRVAFLNKVCGKDEALRLSVEQLLEADGLASGFLEFPLSNNETKKDLTQDRLIGNRVGVYLIKRRIAAGGMGVVYEAEQDDPRRTVAVKVLREGVTSETILRRFVHEAQILSRMQHPNIAHVYQAGVYQCELHRVPYFAMEFLADAKPITTFVRATDISIRDNVRLFLRVCEAVQHGHQRGIIHRDLKPVNILVLPTGEPKVIDFGVARVINSDLTRATDAGKLVGTLRYMSPEQCGGEAADIDTRSDVYALGVVLFEVLSGQLPYDLTTTTPYEIPRVIRDVEPLRMSSFDAALRGDLETVVHKALEKDRNRRYQSVEELARDLRHYLDNEPIEAKRDRSMYVLRKAVLRYKAAVAVAALLFIVVSVSAIVMTLLYREASHQEEIAKHNLDLALIAQHQAAREATTANMTSNFLTGMFEVADPYADMPVSPILGAEITAREIIELGAARLSHELSDEPEVRAALMTTIGHVYKNLGLYEQGIVQLQEAVRIREKLHGHEHPDLAESLTLLAEIQIQQNRYDIAEQHLQRALMIRRSLDVVPDAAMAWTLTTLALLKYGQGDMVTAEPMIREALDIRLHVFGKGHPRVGESLNDLGLITHATKRFDEGQNLFQRTIDLQRNVLGSDHVTLATTLQNFAGLLRDTKEYERATALFEDAIRIKRINLGDKHPSVANSLNNFGALLHDMHEHKRAEIVYREALAIRRLAFREGHPSIAQSLNNIGELLMITNRFSEALPLFNEAWLIRREALGEEHADTLRSFVDSGRAVLQKNA